MARKPGQRRIGYRVQIKPEHADEATAIFAAAGIEPIWIDQDDPFGPDFWFAKMPPELFFAMAQQIPRHFFTKQAYVVGTEPPPGFLT